MFEVSNLTHGYLNKNLFENFTFRFNKGERYGVVGANGSGKSTFLKILAKEIEPDSGSIDCDSSLDIFRVGQDFFINDEEKIVDVAMLGQKEAFMALKRRDELLKHELSSEMALELLGIEEKLQRLDAYKLKAKAQNILEGLGIATTLHHEAISSLSGGYKWRVFLAQVLVRMPDVLMLDEPTNHLDINSITWLENFLLDYKGTIILVSHDKSFLDGITTEILDIDFGIITRYKGNFSSFEKQRSLFLEQKEKEAESKKKEIERKQEFVDRFKAKASKARQAQSRIKQIEKIVIEKPLVSIRVHPKFNFVVQDEGPKLVLEVKHLSKSYGNKVIISDFSFYVQKKEKIAIIGSNGTGKSTLLKALAGEFEECKKFVKWPINVKIGYFAQNCGEEIKKSDKTILDWLWQFYPDSTQGEIQKYLGRVLFTGDDASKKTKALSGGELSRLYLAYLMMLKPNVLLLDEPTNHLDLEAIESLTDSINKFEGTVILVSHDRSFVKNTAKRIIEIKNEREIEDYPGSYQEFLHKKSLQQQVVEKTQKISVTKEGKESYEQQKQKKALILKLNKELNLCMEKIAHYEKIIANIENKFCDENFFLTSNRDDITKLEKEKNDAHIMLNECFSKWEQIEKQLQELT